MRSKIAERIRKETPAEVGVFVRRYTDIVLRINHMPAIVKNTTKGFGHGTLSSEIKNHDNDPLVVKKVQKAKETIQKVGFPGTGKK